MISELQKAHCSDPIQLEACSRSVIMIQLGSDQLFGDMDTCSVAREQSDIVTELRYWPREKLWQRLASCDEVVTLPDLLRLTI